MARDALEIDAVIVRVGSLANVFLDYPGRYPGTAAERAFRAARGLVAALTPGAIGPAPTGDDVADAAALQAAWVQVQQRNGYYLGVGWRNYQRPSLAGYRVRTGDNTPLTPTVDELRISTPTLGG